MSTDSGKIFIKIRSLQTDKQTDRQTPGNT